MLVWVGSIPILLTATVFGVLELAGPRRVMLIVAASSYMLAVQLPTLAINVPLNNKLLEA